MLRVVLFLLLASAVAIAAVAQTAPLDDPGAATPANPYSVTVPVAGTSDAQRDAAIASALSQVLQTVSPGFSASSDTLARASGYVRDFRYRRASGGGLELQVDFDPGAISRLLAASPGNPVAGTAGPAAATTAAAAAQGGSGDVWVDNIRDSHAFASLLSALRSDVSLHDVTPVAAQGDGVMLHVAFDQPLATVLAGLTGPGGHLAVEPQPHPGADAALRWVP